MTESEAIKVVEDAILEHEYKQPNEYTLDSTLEAVGIDSLDIVEMAIVVEDKYKVNFPNSALSKIHTVRDFVTAVMTHVGKQ